MAVRRILLISNSTLHGRGYLDHAEDEIRDILGPAKRILFFPFALHDRDGYAAKARERFAAMGYELSSAHNAADPRKAVAETDAFFIGGGNTFRLLKALQDSEWLDPIRQRVRGGAPYIGSSAGSNVAGPTIKTTNDMPIVEPRSFEALGLVPFQLNPHFQDPDPNSTHMGETREERIAQFHEENETPVLGLREGAWVRASQGTVLLGGTRGARIFRRGEPPVEKDTGDELSSLVGAPE
ncbi:MAG TPA: dipeptidase PepE [Chthoniobacterales bacterium]|nr:dipeptidase PepE [Chthoniobacterales bacterium]